MNESESQEALDACKDEKIHIPSAIQPHGYLLSFDEQANAVLRASANVQDIFGCSAEDIIGKHPSELLAENVVASLRGRSNTSGKNDSINVKISNKQFDGIISHAANEILFELEPKDMYTAEADRAVLSHLEKFCNMLTQTETLPDLFQTFAHHIRIVTGFDRVKVYEFDESWNGKIVAQDKLESMPSYLGLHFPASDIPPQARELYKKNLLRTIVDTTYTAVEIKSAKHFNTPLDMSHSVLRSVSPVHIQYLNNMGVGASMSISIMQDEELWGLVVCHHNEKRLISYKTRMLCEVMSHVLTARLVSIRKQIALSAKSRFQTLLKMPESTDQQDPLKIFEGAEKASIELMGAQTMVLFNDNKIHTCGEPIDHSDLIALRHWYANLNARKVVSSKNIHALLDSAGFKNTFTGGALVAPIGFGQENFVLWYRPPVTTQVAWAGDPQKPAELTKSGYRLTPRNSFESWKTQINDQSLPWEAECISGAEYLVSVIQEHEKRVANASSQAKSDFLSHMSHELRTPLNAISSIVQIMSAESSVNENLKGLISTLDASAKQLTELVNDILDIGKIEAGSIELEEVDFTANELLEEVRSVMSVQASQKSLSLNVHYGKDSQSIIQSDMSKLRQIIFNLVGNAIKFTDTGFINIYCFIDEREAEKNDAELVIEVSDTGMGIPENKLSAIFDKYKQADSSITRKFGGSGLGLAICKSFSAMLGGDITVSSKQGVGTKFTVAVPVKVINNIHNPKDTVALDPKPSSTWMPFNGERVLVVEDYEGNVVAITHFLQSKGLSVTIADNGAMAIDMLHRKGFDIVLMDVQMPVLDGIEATRKIRDGKSGRHNAKIPIIGMTASAKQNDKERCFDVGMNDYISKPLKLDNLLDKIRRIIQ